MVVLGIEDEIRTRMHVGTVAHELPNELDVGFVHRLRIGHDLCHMDGHGDLQAQTDRSRLSMHVRTLSPRLSVGSDRAKSPFER